MYLRMSRQGRALMLRVRPAGWLACGLSFLLLFLGADPTRSVTYQLFALMFCMIAVAVVSSSLFRASGTARQKAPATCVPGRPFTIEIEVKNTGKRKWRGVRVLLVPPPAVPGLDEFIHTPEPGEKSRNAFDRFFIFYRFSWLGERRLTFATTASEPMDLAAGESTVLRLRVMPLRRGVMDLRDVRVARDDVFGFFRRLYRLDSPQARVAVVPRPASIASVSRQGTASRPDPAGQGPWHRTGQSDEFLSLREYRPGDPLQHIHWPAFARSGIPIVREFEDVHRPRTALILDTLLPVEAEAFSATQAFEGAIEVVAAIAGVLGTTDGVLEFLLVQDRAHTFTSGPGHLQTKRLLEILAAVQATTTGGLEPLERLALAHAAQCGNAWFIGVIWDEERLRFLTRLRARGLAVRAIIVTTDTDVAGDVPSWVEILDAGKAIHRKPQIDPNEEAAA